MHVRRREDYANAVYREIHMNRVLRFYMRLFTAAQVAAPAVLLLVFLRPLYCNDYALMIYFQRRAVQFFSAFHRLWGYDPFYSAGYPLNFTWNSNVVLQFLSVLFRPAPEYIVLSVATFASVAMGPLVFWLALGNFGLKDTRRGAALILLCAYWWTGLPAVMMLLGMPSALFAIHLSFLTVSYYYRFFNENDPRVIKWLYVLSPLCFLSHKTAIVLVGMPVAALLIIHIRRVSLKSLAHLAAICALTVAFNSFWLIPFLHLVKYKVTLPEAPHGLNNDPLRIFKDYLTFSKIFSHRVLSLNKESWPIVIPNTIFRVALLTFGIHGFGVLLRERRRATASFLGWTAAFFMALIYFGSFWKPSAELNPTRYIGYMDFFLAVPAVVSFGAIWRRLSHENGQPMQRAVTRLAKPALAIVLVISFAPFLIFLNQIRIPPDKYTLELTAYLRDNTSRNGRIMLEDSGWNDRDGLPPKYAGGHYPALMSDLTGREFIGGPYPYAFLSHHFADFHDGVFLRKRLADFGPEEMRESLDLYNIKWIVCWSRDCKNYFGVSPQTYKHRRLIGKFSVFERTEYQPSPFIAGSGRVVADIKGIRCYRVKPENGKVILKYHYFEGLRATGGGKIRAAHFGRDPIGFIEVDNPGYNFRIINSYKWNSSLSR